MDNRNEEERIKDLTEYYTKEKLNIDKAKILFELLIKLNRFDYAINIFDKLYNLNNNDDYVQDLHYYLYMLSFIVELPENYQKLVKMLNYSNIRINDNYVSYKDIPSYNGVRRKLFKRRFNEAYNELIEITKRNKDYNNHIIEDILLKRCVQENNNEYNIINKFIENERYEEVIYYLEALSNNRNLSKDELGILYICKQLLNENIDVINSNDGSYLSCILNKDYPKALLKLNELDSNAGITSILLNLLQSLNNKVLSRTR